MNPKELLEAVKVKKFDHVINGYKPSQVKNYLKKMVSQYKNLYEGNIALEDELHQLKKEKDFLKEKLIRCQETANDIIESAKKNANIEKQKASKEAEILIERAKEKASLIEQKARETEISYNQLLTNQHNQSQKGLQNLVESFYNVTKKHIQALENDLLDKTKHILNNDIKQLNKEKQIPTQSVFSQVEKRHQELRQKEELFLVGHRINEDIIDDVGHVIIQKNTVVTPQLISEMIDKELYGELIASIEDVNDELA